MATGKLSGKRLLIIEDNQAGAESIVALLHWTGAVCATARTIHDAAPLLAAGPFDAILLDLNLPDSAGYATVMKVQQIARGTPIIVLSGDDGPEVIANAIGSGASDYLVKGDASPATLLRSILYVIEAAAREKTLAVLNEELEKLKGLAKSTAKLDEIILRLEAHARAVSTA